MSAFLRVAKRLNFSVRQSCAPMPATPDDLIAFYQRGADHRIWRTQAATTPGEAEGETHELDIRHIEERSDFRQKAAI